MHYEVYVDLIFLINFMMDGILLLLTAGILKCRISPGRLCLAAGVGALVGVLMAVVYLPYFWLKSLLAYLCGGAGMVLCAFRIRSVRFFAKAFVVLMICTFLMGGIMQSVSGSVRSIGIFFLFAGIAYGCGRWIVKFLETVLVRRQGIYEITLYTKGQCFEVRGKLDTGNSLKDPYTQRPVHVMAKKKAEEFFGEKLNWASQELYRIPYSTVQGEGMMPVLELEKMYLRPVGYGVRRTKARTKKRTIPGASENLTKPIVEKDQAESIRLAAKREDAGTEKSATKKEGVGTEKSAVRKERAADHSGRWIEHPVIGICQIPVFEQEEYEILLNPEGLGGVEL